MKDRLSAAALGGQLEEAPGAALSAKQRQGLAARPRAARQLYLDAAWRQFPRLLSAIDRNPYRPTYGCCDRQFWHYRTASFPSEMYQEAALPLAIAFCHDLPGNRWHGAPRVRELAIAALRYSARSSHADGSCDDYYPFERAFGAAVFSFAAAAETLLLLAPHSPELRDDRELTSWLRRRANWIIEHDESGRLANHHALAALGLARAGRALHDTRLITAAEGKIHQVLSWQSPEGWFEEYGGADPGYQTVTLDCLAKLRALSGVRWLDEALARGLHFARHFLHPDGSYGGEYGSRGTYHFYPAGCELLAAQFADAADLADGYLTALAAHKQPCLEDDRLVSHYVGNWLEAALHWAPHRAPSSEMPQGHTWFPQARLLVWRSAQAQTVVSAARGGVFKHVAIDGPTVTDAGLIVELEDGRLAVSQAHDLARRVQFDARGSLAVEGPLHVCRFETATPLKQAVFHAGMWLAGRWCRTLVRKILQRRLITGRKPAPVHLARRIEFQPDGLVIQDEIQLTQPGAHVRRMSFGVDHESAYVAAANVYQESVVQPWTDLSGLVERLNRQRRVTVVRRLGRIRGKCAAAAAELAASEFLE